MFWSLNYLLTKQITLLTEHSKPTLANCFSPHPGGLGTHTPILGPPSSCPGPLFIPLPRPPLPPALGAPPSCPGLPSLLPLMPGAPHLSLCFCGIGSLISNSWVSSPASATLDPEVPTNMGHSSAASSGASAHSLGSAPTSGKALEPHQTYH